MSSFSCSFLEERSGLCRRLEKDCVPGRSGCVLRNKCDFVIPASERVKENEDAKNKLNDDFPSKRKPNRGNNG